MGWWDWRCNWSFIDIYLKNHALHVFSIFNFSLHNKNYQLLKFEKVKIDFSRMHRSFSYNFGRVLGSPNSAERKLSKVMHSNAVSLEYLHWHCNELYFMNLMTCMMIVVFARKVVRLQYNYKICLNAKFQSPVTTCSFYSLVGPCEENCLVEILW